MFVGPKFSFIHACSVSKLQKYNSNTFFQWPNPWNANALSIISITKHQYHLQRNNNNNINIRFIVSLIKFLQEFINHQQNYLTVQ